MTISNSHDDFDACHNSGDYSEEDVQPSRKTQRRRLVLQYSDDDEEQVDSPSNSEDMVKTQENSDDEIPGKGVNAYEGDSDDDDDSPKNDDQLLHWSPFYDSDFDEQTDPEIYTIVVEDRSCNETERRKMLDGVGCKDRFIACSVENSYRFYARLNQEEASKLQGAKGVFAAAPYRSVFRDDMI